jgi:hypothetical protein
MALGVSMAPASRALEPGVIPIADRLALCGLSIDEFNPGGGH